jgi:hypothetical protein
MIRSTGRDDAMSARFGVLGIGNLALQEVNQAALIDARCHEPLIELAGGTAEIRYFGVQNVYRTKSFRCQNSDTRW